MTSFVLDKDSIKYSYFDELLDKCINRRLAYLVSRYNLKNIQQWYKKYKQEWIDKLKNNEIVLVYECADFVFKAVGVVKIASRKDVFGYENVKASDYAYSGISEGFAETYIQMGYRQYLATLYGEEKALNTYLKFTKERNDLDATN